MVLRFRHNDFGGMGQKPMTERPSICLNMIVRNEAHVIHELLDSIADFIDTWVIVDTGSDDGTQDVIVSHMAKLGKPGHLHERPWRHFGHNRSEAIALAQGQADYIWVMDADDLVAGELDLSNLHADVYQMQIESPGVNYWRRQLFRDGLPWRYEGVVHEHAVCDVPVTEVRLRGDYTIQSRRIGGRNLDPEKYWRDIRLLLGELERDPNDTRSVFYIARSYNSLGDWTNTRDWYRRRVAMGGWEEEVFYSLWRSATAMEMLDEPWPEVLDAYLKAWAFRPSRAEPLHDIAVWYRANGQYELGHLFAQRAAQTPEPTEDALFVNREVYRFRAVDEQAVCASWSDRPAEALELWRRLLGGSNLPDVERPRIAANCDLMANTLLDSTSAYPVETISGLAAGSPDAEVTVTVAGVDEQMIERTLNSFLNCCLDLSTVGRFLIVDEGLSEPARIRLAERYPFAAISPRYPPGTGVTALRGLIGGRLWLHLSAGWHFVAPARYLERLSAVLDAEPDVAAVGLNLCDASSFASAPAVKNLVRDSNRWGGHVRTASDITGPLMIDTARADQTRKAEARLTTATLDEVFCIRLS